VENSWQKEGRKIMMGENKMWSTRMGTKKGSFDASRKGNYHPSWLESEEEKTACRGKPRAREKNKTSRKLSHRLVLNTDNADQRKS